MLLEGRGEDTLGFMDKFVDRLFQYIGGKDCHNVKACSTLSLLDETRFINIFMLDYMFDVIL